MKYLAECIDFTWASFSVSNNMYKKWNEYVNVCDKVYGSLLHIVDKMLVSIQNHEISRIHDRQTGYVKTIWIVLFFYLSKTPAYLSQLIWNVTVFYLL